MGATDDGGPICKDYPTCLRYMLFPEELGPVMTLILPLSPLHSVELGTKVRAQSSIRGCLQ